MTGKETVSQAEPRKPLWKRVGWLIFIYVASIVTLGAFALLIRLFMTAAGMKSH